MIFFSCAALMASATRRVIRQALLQGNTPNLSQALRQRLPLQVLHHDVSPAVAMHIAVVDLDDARVLYQGGGAGLDEEPPHHLRIQGALGQQHLDRRASVDALVLGQKHLAHRAFAQLGNGLEAAKPLAQHLPPQT